MASAMSVTCNSSKHSSRASEAIRAAIGGMGSSPRLVPNTSLRLRAVPSRHCFTRSWMRAMKAWKWARTLFCSGVEE